MASRARRAAAFRALERSVAIGRARLELPSAGQPEILLAPIWSDALMCTERARS
jgi:hypothetical protein